MKHLHEDIVTFPGSKSRRMYEHDHKLEGSEAHVHAWAWFGTSYNVTQQTPMSLGNCEMIVETTHRYRG